jgi:tRNA(Ile)-lysidine synthetase-like protein
MEIIEHFTKEWFSHPEWWFTSNIDYDNYITENYQDLLNINVIEKNDYLTPLIKVIIFDQLPRHIFRNEYSHHIIDFYLIKALDIVNNNKGLYINSLTSIEWTFFMLPLRHSKIPKNIMYVIDETWIKLKSATLSEDLHIYKRFLKATYLRYIRDCGNNQELIDICCEEKINHDMFLEIIHYYPIHYPNMKEDIKVKYNNQIYFNSKLINTEIPIIISLSGGVDSMICSYILKRKYPKANIVAVHINYDNRDVCDQEMLFIKDWCYHIGIPLYIRKINEIHREDCMHYELRDLYETYTRNVRYNTYKIVNNLSVKQNKKVVPEIPELQVILGHNKDDCFENIMTNIAHKNKYDNLQGMLPVVIQDDITFKRPLLEASKDDIIKFAHLHNIPYLPNSTPIWSQRGQIRNNVIPCLDSWDRRLVPSLFVLSDTLKSLYSILSHSVSNFIDKGEYLNNAFTINVEIKKLETELLFWREVIYKITKIYASSKSIENMIISLKKIKNEFCRLPCNENKKIVITKQLIISITKVSQDMVDICFMCE